MKIAVATEDKDVNALVSERAGRAPYYLIFEISDGKTKLLEIIDNPFKMGSGGAGFSVAKMLADKNVDIIIAGKFGPNMEMAMNERKVKYNVAQGNADKAAVNAAKDL